jgi:pilus assembly protein Flp/PilA
MERRHRKGATAIEYALIACLIALVGIGAITLVGISLSATFDTVTAAMPLSAMSGGGVGGGASAGGGFGSGGSAGSGMGGAFFGP